MRAPRSTSLGSPLAFRPRWREVTGVRAHAPVQAPTHSASQHLNRRHHGPFNPRRPPERQTPGGLRTPRRPSPDRRSGVQDEEMPQTAAEGMNLQQCRNVINYDLPWNPMRLIQRHGRVDRIGSPHREVFLRTFFPDQQLDAMLNLEERVRRKLAQAAASVGVEDAPIEYGATGEQDLCRNPGRDRKAPPPGRRDLRVGWHRGRRADRRGVPPGAAARSPALRRPHTGAALAGRDPGKRERVYLRSVPLDPDREIVTQRWTTQQAARTGWSGAQSSSLSSPRRRATAEEVCRCYSQQALRPCRDCELASCSLRRQRCWSCSRYREAYLFEKCAPWGGKRESRTPSLKAKAMEGVKNLRKMVLSRRGLPSFTMSVPMVAPPKLWNEPAPLTAGAGVRRASLFSGQSSEGGTVAHKVGNSIVRRAAPRADRSWSRAGLSAASSQSTQRRLKRKGAWSEPGSGTHMTVLVSCRGWLRQASRNRRSVVRRNLAV